MTRDRFWEWDGERLSVAEICNRHPVYSEKIVRDALREGVRGLAEMQARDWRQRAKAQAAQRANAAKQTAPFFGRPFGRVK